MGQRKTLQELTIRDNFMFGAVMADEEICREFLELVLGFPIESVTVSKEKSMAYHPEYKGVRLDIVAKDEDHTHYNVEMQALRKPKLGKRSRYYHSQIDMELLLAGMEYEELSDAFVIFICDFDPFGRKKYRYTFGMMCKEDAEARLDDGSSTIFLSTHGENKKEVPEALVKFLEYVRAELADSTADFEDEYVRKIQEAVKNVKSSREMEERYMLLEELIRDERKEAKAEGRTEGKLEGTAENVLELLEDLGEVPEELRVRIMSERELDILRTYLRKASSAKSMEEFEAWLREQEC